MVSNYIFSKKGSLKLLLCLVFALCAVQFTVSGQALADGGIQISTPYPGTTVNTGATATFPIKVSNKSGEPQNIQLSVASIPDGWEGHYTASGNTITRVYLDNDATCDVNFVLSVPEGAAEGTYRVVLKADCGSRSSTFLLELNATKNKVSEGKFTSQFTELAGTNTTAFKFSASITNNSGANQSYSLSSNAPSGWTVTFAPSYQSQYIASLSVNAGSTQGLDIAVTPSSSAPAGDYVVTCSAVSAQETLNLELKIKITGSYKITLDTQSSVLSSDVYAGKDTRVALVVKNTGSMDLNNINLTATKPDNWSVTFDKGTIETIAAGQTQTITATIRPADNAIAGDYNIYFGANTKETSASITFRATVKTATAWWIISVAAILVLAVGLAVLFTKLGRR